VGDNEADAHPVGVPDTLRDPEEERLRDAVGLAEGHRDGGADTVAHPEAEAVAHAVRDILALPLAEPHIVGLREVMGERLPVAHPEPLLDALEQPEAERQRDAVGLPLALFVIPLLPVLGFTDFAYQNNSTVADRYMYLALLGPAVAGAMAIDRLQAVKDARPGGSPPLAAGILVALLCLLLTWQQVALWRDSLTLFTSSLKSGHESSVALNNLGIALTESGRPDDALPLLLRAVERDPTDAGGWFNLGNAHAAADEFTEAGQAFDRCLALDGERFKAWNNLGLARLFQSDAAGAEAAWLESIRIRPRFADARLNLAKLLLSRGESAVAAEHVQTVLERDRTHAEAHNMLGVIHAAAGRSSDATACFEAAVKFAPRREDFRANLERARQGQLP
jgi:Flp pilus assembly protein TadD